ncbi:MAG: cystathionine beta-synthase [Flavobacteriales bacterium]|jgi:cystathionine beta-lyase/cystathionine gamma-synthase
MQENNFLKFTKQVVHNMPVDWLTLTTHRLDIYNESKAKTEFLEQFEVLFAQNNSEEKELMELPTAYDYIRLGHPLSCVLEWTLARTHKLNPQSVISFSSETAPVLSVLRTNLLKNKNTLVAYFSSLPKGFDEVAIKKIYGYKFETQKVSNRSEIKDFEGSVLYISEETDDYSVFNNIDFHVSIQSGLGSMLFILGENKDYVSDIQHVRRRETIAMTPSNSLIALNILLGNTSKSTSNSNRATNKSSVIASIKEITGTQLEPTVASSGLSMQYAIMMGLIDHAQENHPDKGIRFVVPTNCYGGTNDQARRVAACLDNVEVVDLAVDGDNDMVQSIDVVLEKIAKEDAIPYIIAEIPTNPRVEVPELEQLKIVLSKTRQTAQGNKAIDSVFILDQTFCPNIHFLGEGEILSTVRAISYASGSKFPSGGKCTAGYCAGNNLSGELMEKIHLHLAICDNEATDLQYEILAAQLPSMNQRIADAYTNTREFVNFIKEHLPEAKINFVSEELAKEGFTPSLFSLDLPTKGNSPEERENYKRELNLVLINKMITEIPTESKYCVSYGQLKGCYWTIPATSTQGTTKEGDKDYIARVALSGNMDLEKHKAVFLDFVNGIS